MCLFCIAQLRKTDILYLNCKECLTSAMLCLPVVGVSNFWRSLFAFVRVSSQTWPTLMGSLLVSPVFLLFCGV